MSEHNNNRLKKTPLYQSHCDLGGKMVPFAGWMMPVQYEGIKIEHKAVRSQAGIFDVSHMGEIEFWGPDAFANVQRLVTNNVGRLKDGGVLYTGMLYKNGTFVDDLLVYRKGEDHYLLVVNAANTDKDFDWIKKNIFGKVSVENISDTVCQIALQGPKAQEIFAKVSSEPAANLKYFTFLEGKVAGVQGIISRTGYTGEDGVEVYTAWDKGLEVWNAFIESGKEFGLKPAGLGARDTLRLEAGLALYGNDISDTKTPLEAGLRWTVKFKSGDFNGREALLRQKRAGLQQKLAGFQMVGRGIARPHYPVYDTNEEKVAEVASGAPGITVGKQIGNAYLPLHLTEIGTKIFIGIRKKLVEAEIVSIPFYQRS